MSDFPEITRGLAATDPDADLHCAYCGEWSHAEDWRETEEDEYFLHGRVCPRCQAGSRTDDLFAWDRWRLATRYGVLTVERIAAVIAALDAHGGHECHEGEDMLYRTVLKAIATGLVENPAELAAAVLKSQDLPFERWYA